jgi:lysophospholipase L1-like esterase
VKEDQHTWREDLDPKIEVVRRLAAEYDALLVPADVEFNHQALTVGATTLADDGVHPTAAGHQLLADLWRRTVFATDHGQNPKGQCSNKEHDNEQNGKQ